jgi:hypothetical protein
MFSFWEISTFIVVTCLLWDQETHGYLEVALLSYSQGSPLVFSFPLGGGYQPPGQLNYIPLFTVT